MRFWLVSFFILFAAAEGLNWLGSLEWLKAVNLSVPVVAAAGLGLAIASNAPPFRPRFSPPSQKPAPPPPAPPSPAPAPPAVKDASISFEIHKPQRRP